ncbi:DUF4912 domain-containing protein [Paenibacillus hamazuiensis]|uniref:DUF4912 domain-containing protein n=1 Tax=Paenibacillus hamazuiensis TaxID=2936508 RepID=UPI00200D0C08|nr:DUF4912 domain-containing protein [Paenibacillus hamazuiensis]
MNTIPTAGYEVPDRYNRDLLHLMVRDAHTLYAYWEVSDRKRWLCSQHFECDWHVLPKILRVYDVTCIYFNGHNANSSFDIRTTPEANNWYIPNVHANATYMADLGTYTIHGQFVPLMRSNAAATPRDAKAAWGEPVVGAVEEVLEGKANGRIEPHFFENFNAYGNCTR